MFSSSTTISRSEPACRAFCATTAFASALRATDRSLWARSRSKIDLVLLDIMLPGTDGLELCRRLRASQDIPVIMLTAVTANADRVIGLELGADDYICKPFDPRELVARIRSVLRRSKALPAGGRPETGSVYVFDDWSLDVVKRMLTSPSGALVDLTTGEFDLLHAFVEFPQRVLTRDQLLDIARGRSSVLFDRSIDVQVSRLRRKIEADPQRPLLIKTVRGGGYLFTGRGRCPMKRELSFPLWWLKPGLSARIALTIIAALVALQLLALGLFLLGAREPGPITVYGARWLAEAADAAVNAGFATNRGDRDAALGGAASNAIPVPRLAREPQGPARGLLRR